MKKKIFATVLPILAGVTLVGTGFSVWYFTSTNTTADLEVHVDMAGYVSVGSLTPTPSATKLYLDSTTTGDNDHNGINLMSSDSDYVTGNDINLKFTATTENENSGTISGNATVTLTLTVDNDVDNYIAFGLDGKTFDPNSGDSTTTYTYTTDSIAVNSATVIIDMPAFTFDYEEGKEPTDVNSYNILAGVITDSTIIIKYELNWAN